MKKKKSRALLCLGGPRRILVLYGKPIRKPMREGGINKGEGSKMEKKKKSVVRGLCGILPLVRKQGLKNRSYKEKKGQKLQGHKRKNPRG